MVCLEVAIDESHAVKSIKKKLSTKVPRLIGAQNGGSMKDQNCAYCMRGELLDAFGIYVCDLTVSSVILFKEQSKRGRFIVAYKDHVSELVDITEEERNAFMADVAKVATAMHKTFQPDKINYGMYGDTGCHLHMHLVPKYKDSDEWGGTFQMNPQKTFLTEEEYNELAEALKKNL